MHKLGTVALWTLAVLLLPMMAGAEEVAGAAADTNSWGSAVGAGFACGWGALGWGIGPGLPAGNTTAGIARNPGAAGSMFTNFILGMVLIESIAIYALVVGLLLVFAIP
jgi:F-type H+-transporting ATPase subunit c